MLSKSPQSPLGVQYLDVPLAEHVGVQGDHLRLGPWSQVQPVLDLATSGSSWTLRRVSSKRMTPNFDAVLR